MNKIYKSNKLYLMMLSLWACLMVFAVPSFVQELSYVDSHNSVPRLVLTILLILNAVFISYFWLNGVKDIVYVAYYYIYKNKMNKYVARTTRVKLKKSPAIVLVYCTANDFNEHSLERSMRQKYDNYKTVILDDSNKSEYIDKIDHFASKHNIEVVRRKDREGFKAGNLNNYLKNRADYEYFVILDSDEIIPTTFITSALKYFNRYSNVGVVQANHVATRNRNLFMRIFAKGVDSHWPTYQMTKHYCGFMSLLGHGAMISRECYEAVEAGFPHVVAEDLCFSIEARIKGYYVAFSQNIRCQEEYPVDYLAFKKRHSKWTQGNMEFIKTYTRRIFTSNMSWYEKLDIVLFTYNLPLTAFFAFYIVINLIILPFLDYNLSYPAWLLIPTIIFLFAPMLNDIVYHNKREKIGQLMVYLLSTFILYGSMFYISLIASLKSILGAKAYFHVTPKVSSRVSFFEAIVFNRNELFFALTLIYVSIVMVESILPILMIAAPSILSVYLSILSNFRSRVISIKNVYNRIISSLVYRFS
jgi:cellulose synthase/poly-beta-1,6-N-acetylglucosamine synthase-like glycosyltransferase